MKKKMEEELDFSETKSEMERKILNTKISDEITVIFDIHMINNILGSILNKEHTNFEQFV